MSLRQKKAINMNKLKEWWLQYSNIAVLVTGTTTLATLARIAITLNTTCGNIGNEPDR